MNVFYSNGTLAANEAWMITRQLGYTNNFVLEGGLNYWFDAILNPQMPASTSPDEDFAKYDFRKSAGQALGEEQLFRLKRCRLLVGQACYEGCTKKKKASGGC